MALVFVTNNDHKFREVHSILGPLGIHVWQKKMNLFEKDSNSPAEIALEKARHAFSKLKLPLITEDTSVFFDAYNNFPGTKPKRAFEQMGYEGLFRKLKGRHRKAHFHTAICLMDYNDKYKIFEATWAGTITKEVILPESDRMPYEKIFVPEGKAIALAQMSREEKNELSHRAQATRKLARYLIEKKIASIKNRE
ncbi:MAG: non-canonical purine NTP pyrophosphatase [Candidatus ainarchaeum sp.]|nr:non-canonical purine NTP pyrophosphatase [Candidatus ainarchaeum sp.]